MKVLVFTAASIIAASISGCAQFVEKKKKVNGPVPEVGVIEAGGGRVRYALKGPRFIVRRRRKNAFKKITKYCGGRDKFRILGEVSREDVETPFNSTDLDVEKLLEAGHFKVESFRHIEFQCL